MRPDDADESENEVDGERPGDDVEHDVGLRPGHVERAQGEDHEELKPGDEPLGHLLLLADGDAHTLWQGRRVGLGNEVEHGSQHSHWRGIRGKRLVDIAPPPWNSRQIPVKNE